MAVYYAYEEDMKALSHHGIKDQKWGIRRFQNPDGTLTEAGKKRYYKLSDRMNKSYERSMKNLTAIRTGEELYSNRTFGKRRNIKDIYKADKSNKVEKKKINRDLEKLKKFDNEGYEVNKNKYEDVLNKKYVSEQSIRDLRKIKKDKLSKLSDKGKDFIENNGVYSNSTVVKKVAKTKVSNHNKAVAASLVASVVAANMVIPTSTGITREVANSVTRDLVLDRGLRL